MTQKQNEKIFYLLSQLWMHFSFRQKVKFLLLFILMIITGFAEVISLGMVLPFLAVLTDPQSFFEIKAIQPILALANINSPEEILFPLTVLFAAAAIIAGCMRFLQTYANVRVSFDVGAYLSIEVYKRTLYQPYLIHVGRNSSTIINAVSLKTAGVITGGIFPVLSIATSLVILLSIVSTLLVIDPTVALSALFGFTIVYGVIINLTRKKLMNNGILIARESDHVVKSLQEGLGGIRDVIIDGTQDLYSNVYGRAVLPLYRARANNLLIAQSPRFGIEAFGIVIIASLAYWLVSQPGGFTKAIPILGTLAFGAQRVLPAMQQIYVQWSALQGNTASLKDVIELLKQPLPNLKSLDKKVLTFKKKIELRGLNFRYENKNNKVLTDINLSIAKGAKVGFIGVTGSGKSTLLDIIMGLLQPSEGVVRVDGTTITVNNQRAWQRNIAHVPQSIFLADSSVEENIAFAVPKNKIDRNKVKNAAKRAKIADLIETWPNKYNTFVGERGERLSGGQRQRIGIARALYKQSDVIIFDEATSALDNQTETEVVTAIDELGGSLTMLIVAHRLTTLKNCQMIVELENGRIINVGTYNDIIVPKINKN